jgi:hypothetical protein
MNQRTEDLALRDSEVAIRMGMLLSCPMPLGLDQVEFFEN